MLDLSVLQPYSFEEPQPGLLFGLDGSGGSTEVVRGGDGLTGGSSQQVPVVPNGGQGGIPGTGIRKRPRAARRWCFTLNNYDAKEEDELLSLASGEVRSDIGLRFIIVGRETGASGTPHLQGYVEFMHGVSLDTVKRRLACLQRAHLEIANGGALFFI